MKQLKIDFLYLDLNTCERCMTTDETLKKALNILTNVFQTLDYQAIVNSINITSKELAKEHRFISSPTIRVNGVDICTELVESDCKDCGNLCGDSVECRVFVYEGKQYEQPPVPMIVDGILKAIYGQKRAETETYIIPDNLIRFFEGKTTCCEPDCDCNDYQTNNNLKEMLTMKKMSIYEPAMCCETGLCGVGIDPELLRISTVLGSLKKKGIEVKRYNLNNYPQEFVKNVEINKLIMGDGVDSLPATIVDGKIVKTKKYPTNAEIIELLGVPKEYLGEEQKQEEKESGCCCGEGGCC